MTIEDATAKFRKEVDERTVRQIVRSSAGGVESEAGEANEY